MKGKQKKELSMVKCFNCDEMGHYLSGCPMKKKGDDKNRKGKQVVGVATLAKIDDLTRILKEEEFDMFSNFSQGTIDEDGWYVDNGATKHVTGSQDVFETLAKWDSKLHMVLGEKNLLEIRGLGLVPFRMETRHVM